MCNSGLLQFSFFNYILEYNQVMDPIKNEPFSFRTPVSQEELKRAGLFGLFAFTVGGVAIASKGRRVPTATWQRTASNKVRQVAFSQPQNPVATGSRMYTSAIPSIGAVAKKNIPLFQSPPAPAKRSYEPQKGEGKALGVFSMFMQEEKAKEMALFPQEQGFHKIEVDLPKDYEVSDRTVGHQADFLVRGTNLEGFNIKSTASHVQTFAELAGEQGVISPKTAKKLSSFFESMQEIPHEQMPQERGALAQEIAGKVSSLKPGESLSMQGGWSEKDGFGHALIYTFTKKENGLCDAYIYNTGAGTETYHAKLEVERGMERETLICPYVKFQDVSLESLGITGEKAYPEFFERLIEIKQGINCSGKPFDIYEDAACFGALHGHLVAPSADTAYISGQRSGTCAYRVVAARIRSEFESVEEFERFDFSLQYTDCIALFNENTSLQNNPSIKVLLENQGKKLLRLKEERSHLFSKEEITKAENKINEMLDVLARSQVGWNPTSQLLAPLKDETVITNQEWESLQVREAVKIEEEIIPVFRMELVTGPKNLQEIQENLAHIVENKTDPSSVLYLERVAEALLSISQEELKSLPQEEAEKLVSQIHDVAFSYANTRNREFLRTEIVRNTLWSLAAISYELTLHSLPALANYKVSTVDLLRDAERELYLDCSPSGREVFKQIATRLSESGRGEEIFCFFKYGGLISGYQLPPETSWLESIAYPEEKTHLSKTDRLELLFKEDLFKGVEGRALIKFRDIVYLANLTSPSLKIKDGEEITRVHNSFFIFENHSEALLYSRGFNKKSCPFREVWQVPGDAIFYSTFESENRVLCYPKSHLLGRVPPSAISNESLRCSNLISYFSENFMKLKDPKEQELFLNLLFQSVPGTNNGKSPPIFNEVRNEAFVEQLTQFIEQGASFFSEARLLGRPDLKSALFFSQLARKVQEIDPSLKLPSFQVEINQWLETPQMTSEERSHLHLHRILQYKGSDIEKLSPKQLQEISSSWIFSKSRVFPMEGNSRQQKEEAMRFMQTLAPKLRGLSHGDFDQIADSTLGPGIVEKGLWTYTGEFSAKKGDWGFDILNGRILKNGSTWEVGAYRDFQDIPIYVKMFKDFQPEQVKKGSVYEFKDPKTGELFRGVDCVDKGPPRFQAYLNGAWEDSSPEQFGMSMKDVGHAFRDISGQVKDPSTGTPLRLYGSSSTLQVYFQGDWYENLDVDLPEIRQISMSILETCHVFQSGSSRIFLDKKTREIRFKITKEGSFVDLRNQNKVAYQKESSSQPLSLFEDNLWRIHKLDAEGNKKILFPRLMTPSGNELALVEKKGVGFVLEENPANFVLVPPIRGVLGVLENVLCFQNKKTGDMKVLVPIRPVENTEELAPEGRLNDPLKMKVGSYAEYSIKKGKVTPKDRQAKAFLIYQYLMQKKEIDAAILLDGLGKERALTPQIREILSWIANAPLKSSNQTPAAVAIAIKAAMMIAQEALEFPLEDLMADYRMVYNDIPAELRLSKREIEEFNLLCPHNRVEEGVSIDTPVLSWEQREVSGKVLSFYIDDKVLQGFKEAYQQLQGAGTAEEKKLIVSRTSNKSFPDELKELLLLAVNFPGSLPSLPETFLVFELSEWCKVFRKKAGEASRAPTQGLSANKDPVLVRGTPLRKLSDALKEVNIPSYSNTPASTLPARPLMDLRSRFVSPYFTEVKKEGQPQIAPLQLPGDLDPLYASGIQREVREANEEIALGQKINERESSFVLRHGKSLDAARQSLTKTLEEMQTDLLSRKEAILALARQKPEDPLKAEKSSRLERGDLLAKITFEKLLNCYLKGSYEEASPHLRDDQVEELDFKIREFLAHGTQAQQIERALEENPAQMGQTLHAEMAYTPSSHKAERIFLVYEYRANLRIRKEQVDAIRTMLSKKNVTLQMLMGGGKTTVLTSILLETIEPGRIAFFIPPDAQFETQVENLSETQHKYYSKPIIQMKLERKDLDLKTLKKIRGNFKDAKKHQKVVVTTASTLQTFQLEWIDLLAKNLAKDTTDYKRLNILTELLRDIKGDGAFVIDEVDQVLNLFKEMNFPVGDKTPLKPSYVNFLESVFDLHLEPSIENELKLLKGEQSSLPKEVYKKKILPKIANAIFEQYKGEFGLEDHQKDAFLSYILNGTENLDLRALLEERIEKGEESAQLVFLAKGVLFDILPSLMRKSSNKDYGIPKGDVKRKVVPYLGVDSPASTEFAGPYETACYQYLSALFYPITEGQLHNLSEKFIESAALHMQYHPVKLEDTEEYRTFKQITGASLDKIYQKDPEAMQKILQDLKADPKKRLELEKEYISIHAGAFSSYYRSNPLSLCGMAASKVGLTGTPSNRGTYPKELRENTALEKGTEGRVRSVLLQRSDSGLTTVRFTPSNDAEQVLKAGLENNPRKNQFRALLDPVGLFKDRSNEEVARGTLEYMGGSEVDAALYYSRQEGNMGIPGSLMVLRKSKEEGGGYSKEPVGGTGKGALESKGIDPNTTASNYDERHCEATDIPQIPDALGVVTASSSLSDRDLLQTVFRLRGYLKGQDVDFVIPEDERKNYPKDVTARDILMQATVTQAIRNADERGTSFPQQIEHSTRQNAYEMLLENPSYQTFQEVRESFVVNQDLSPYAVFGQVVERKPPLEVFDACCARQPAHLADKAALAALRREMEENIEQFPATVPLAASRQGMQMEMSLKQETEVETDRNVEVDQELQFYLRKPGMSREEIANNKSQSLESLFRNRRVEYRKPYEKLFKSSELRVSENFAYTEESLLPVFAMQQKIGSQVLITRSYLVGRRVTFISAEEGALKKQEIRDGLEDAWLYLPNGKLTINSKEAPPVDHAELGRAFLDVNIFNGNVSYLVEHKEEVFAKLDGDPEMKDLLLHFLALKTVDHPEQRGALERLRKELEMATL